MHAVGEQLLHSGSILPLGPRLHCLARPLDLPPFSSVKPARRLAACGRLDGALLAPIVDRLNNFTLLHFTGGLGRGVGHAGDVDRHP